jgi:signal transduction histidine kinase
MCRYESDSTLTFVAHWGSAVARFPVGTRRALGGHNLGTLVFETGRPARVDRYADSSSGALGAVVREAALRSAVGTPIIVDGRLWGLIAAGSSLEQPLPPDTETRLASFTELVATAVANTHGRAALGRLAEEQAALRRVATLVAHGAPPEQVFAAVAEEVGGLLDVDYTVLIRSDPEDMITVVGAWTATGVAPPSPVGSRFDLGGRNVSTLTLRTGRPARLDAYVDVTGSIGNTGAYGWGFRSSVGVPISVEGRLWGLILVAYNRDQPLPAETEARLASFAELMATAIANTESRAALTRLAEEQAALRRMATLVAQGVPPVEIFSAVSDEVAHLFKGARAAVLRFEHDEPAVVFAGVSKSLDLPVGTRWEFQPGMVSTEVYRTGCSARVDAMDWLSARGPVAGAARRLGTVSTVGSPILVEARLWGVMTVASASELLPFGTERRLKDFTELLATAIANAESRSELAASRRRIVAASDEARRRIERDLHDGTQQRLVSLGLAARAAEANVPADRGDLRGELSRIAAGLSEAVAELQEFSRGIHPAILSERGLGPALRTLARRSSVPVDLDVTPDARFPEPIETAAYYVASEALANAMKHAQASHVVISLAAGSGSLLLSIRDDGVGGADPARGSGLAGLTDRVEALGGSIRLDSVAGVGTHITVDLPG